MNSPKNNETKRRRKPGESLTISKKSAARAMFLPGALIAASGIVGLFAINSQAASGSTPAATSPVSTAPVASAGSSTTSTTAATAATATTSTTAVASNSVTSQVNNSVTEQEKLALQNNPSAGNNYPSVDLSGANLARGQSLFEENCATCHGSNAYGTERGPVLVGVGAAAVDFWVSTGRMPLSVYSAQPFRKPPRFGAQDIRNIAAWVNSLDPNGPGIPIVNLSNANEATGNDLYVQNCAGCHVITGVGDALSGSVFAPTLSQASPTQIQEAVRTGPLQMPRFSTFQLSQAQLNDITKYVTYLRRASDPGGAGLGHVGPVAEGFIGLLVGVGGLMMVAYWVGDRS